VVKDNVTARAVFPHVAPALFRPLAGCGESIGGWQGLPLPFCIGEGTKVFKVGAEGEGCELNARDCVKRF
jgi:hypothetical protein